MDAFIAGKDTVDWKMLKHTLPVSENPKVPGSSNLIGVQPKQFCARMLKPRQVPFLIHAGREFVNALRDDSVLKSTFDSFTAGFEGTERETKPPGRAQLHVEEGLAFEEKLKEAIEQLGTPPDLLDKFDDDSLKLLDSPDQKKWMTTPSVYGFGSKTYYAGSEFLSTECLRVQFDVARRVAIVPYDKLRAMFMDFKKIKDDSNI
eukprot:9477934-Pyramimonas_sp.AAC.1